MGLGVEGGGISIELRVARIFSFRAYWVGRFGEGSSSTCILSGARTLCKIIKEIGSALGAL